VGSWFKVQNLTKFTSYDGMLIGSLILDKWVILGVVPLQGLGLVKNSMGTWPGDTLGLVTSSA
jgi:hypothetical protein